VSNGGRDLKGKGRDIVKEEGVGGWLGLKLGGRSLLLLSVVVVSCWDAGCIRLLVSLPSERAEIRVGRLWFCGSQMRVRSI